MEIKNIEGLSHGQIREMVNQGGKFVIYKYCISIVVMTFNRPTDVYFIKPNESSISPAIGYLICSLFLGWWGIPWGPIYTIGNIANVLGGGTNVTNEIMSSINQQDPNFGTGNTYNLPNQQTPNITTSQDSDKPQYNIN